MEDPIKNALSRLYVPNLTFFARTLRLAKKLTRKGELIDALTQELVSNPGSLVRKLNDTETRVISEVVHNKGTYKLCSYKAKYSDWCPAQEPDSWSHSASLVWLFCRLEAGSYVMPPRLVEVLASVVPKPAPSTLHPLDTIPSAMPDKRFGSRPIHIHSGSDIALLELGRILGLVKADLITVQPGTQKLTTHAWEAMAKALIPHDFTMDMPPRMRRNVNHVDALGPIRPHAWGRLIQQCGWGKRFQDTLNLTAEGKMMLAGKDLGDFPKGVRRFIASDTFDELTRIDGLPAPSNYVKRFLRSPSERRTAIWQSMQNWPQGKWLAVSEVFRYLVASDSGFRTYDLPYGLSLGYPVSGETFYPGEHVDRIFLRTCLFESLGTLGLLDLAYVCPHFLWPDTQNPPLNEHRSSCTPYDGLLHVRINELGSSCLRSERPVGVRGENRPKVFRVLPNNEICTIRKDKLPNLASYLLRSMAKQTSEFVWQIDRDTVLKHLESGSTMKNLVDLLEAFSQDGVPDNVKVYLNDLARKAACVIDSEDAVLFELADDHVAAEIAGDKKTAKYCRVAFNRFLVVSRRDRRSFARAARKLGYVFPL
jgi:hypothetical protein